MNTPEPDLLAPRTSCAALLLALALVPIPSSGVAAQSTLETVVVAPGARLVPVAGPDLTVEAGWGDQPVEPVEELAAPLQGDHRLTLRSRDRAGVASPERRLLVRVDGAGPRLELRIEPPARDGWAAPGAVATLVATDDPGPVASSSLRLATGNGGSDPSTASSRVTLPRESGAVALAARATDVVGNRTEQRYEVHIDPAPPAAILEIEAASATSRRGWTVYAPELTLRLTASDSDSGVRSATLSLDGDPIDATTWSGRLAHGSHRVEAEVVDGVGNRSTADLRFEVDAVGPEIVWHPTVPAAAGRRRSRAAGRLEVVATDADAGGAQLEWATRPEGPWQPYEIGEGPTSSPVFFRAHDLLGNPSELRVEWKAPSSDEVDAEERP